MKNSVYNRRIINLIILFFITSLVSCKDRGQEPEIHPEPNIGIISRPVGQSKGEPWFETIGPEGGTVKSPDGRIEIEIPQGAVTTDTEIGIEPIENTNPGGIGNGFRLTPHGQQFKKEVTVRFSYKGFEKRISSEKAIQLAYQDDKGVWRCAGGVTQDALNKKVAIKTTHFSDWSFIATMELTPSLSAVSLGGTVNLKAVRYIFPADEDGLVPLALPETGMGEPIKLESKYIVKWTLNGPGSLKGNGNEAIYTAPTVKPNNNTATVTVELNVNGKMVLLIGTIYIVEDGFHISFDGGPWTTYPAMAAKSEENHYIVGNLMLTQDLPQISVQFSSTETNLTNLYSWNMEDGGDNATAFEYFDPGRKHVYVSIYDTEENKHIDSPGILDLKEETINGKKYLSGLFYIEPAGYFETTTEHGDQIKTSTIHGAFRVQAKW